MGYVRMCVTQYLVFGFYGNRNSLMPWYRVWNEILEEPILCLRIQIVGLAIPSLQHTL